MKSNSSYPILAKEGWGIIGAAIFITLLVWWLIGGFISFIFCVRLVVVIQFFRDPPRAISQTPHSVLSGADGRICKVQKVENPYTGKEEILISTFMNVFNIHSNRSPIGGTVEAIYYKPGKFLNADLDKASMENERNAIIIKSDEGPVITSSDRRLDCPPHYLPSPYRSGSYSRRTLRFYPFRFPCRRLRSSQL